MVLHIQSAPQHQVKILRDAHVRNIRCVLIESELYSFNRSILLISSLQRSIRSFLAANRHSLLSVLIVHSLNHRRDLCHQLRFSGALRQIRSVRLILSISGCLRCFLSIPGDFTAIHLLFV